MHLKVFAVLALCCIVCYATDCQLQRRSIWARYTLKCVYFGDVCPLKSKTPGIGGIEKVEFGQGCPSVRLFENWVVKYKKVLYSFTEYRFNCSCDTICSYKNVHCINNCPTPSTTPNNAGAIAGTAAVTGGVLGGIWAVYTLIKRFRRNNRQLFTDLNINDGEGEAGGTDSPGSSDATTEIKVVDQRPRDSRGRFVST